MAADKNERILTTKEKIFIEAVKLFSDGGYSEVSVRDIASTAGINVSSLYFHYSSKEEILNLFYDYYMENWKKSAPDLDELLKLAETAPIDEIFKKMDFRFDPAIRDTMNRIVKIAIRQMAICPHSEKFIQEFFLNGCSAPLIKILEKLTELGKIEPIDINAVVCLISRFAVSAAMFQGTALQVNQNEWRSGLDMAFSLIKPTGK